MTYKNANNTIMLHSISTEPGIFEEIFTTSGLCSFTTAVWHVSSSLSQECSHSPVSFSIKSEIENIDNAPVFSSAAGRILRSLPETALPREAD